MKVNIHTHFPKDSELTITSVGVHPYDAASISPETLLSISDQSHSVDAIGEIGLDYYCNTDRELQIAALHDQLKIAQRQNKGVVLHCVKAFEPIMKIIEQYKLRFVIFHGFIGSAEQALRATAKGYYLSFGHRTFQSPKSIEAMRAIATDRLFLETDNSEISIDEIYSKAADILGINKAKLEEIINENYRHICG